MSATALAGSDEIERFLALVPMPACVVQAGRVIAANDRFCAMLSRWQFRAGR